MARTIFIALAIREKSEKGKAEYNNENRKKEVATSRNEKAQIRNEIIKME